MGKAGTWVYDKDLECMVPKHGRNYHNVSEKRSDLACPYMQAGGMPEIMSHTNGRYYDTKRNYYKEVRRANCEIVGMTRADREWNENRFRKSGPYGTQAAHKQHFEGIVKDVKASIEINNTQAPGRTRYKRKKGGI